MCYTFCPFFAWEHPDINIGVLFNMLPYVLGIAKLNMQCRIWLWSARQDVGM